MKKFGKKLSRTWSVTSTAVKKAGDSTFERVAHSTFDKADHWHSEYDDDQEMYLQP